MRSVQRDWHISRIFVSFVTILIMAAACRAVDIEGLNGIESVPIERLSSQPSSLFAKMALRVHPEKWKHAESANFIYHYISGFIATPLSIEAESYYRVIVADLGRERPAGQPKGHIFIFEDPKVWQLFVAAGGLDPWTGGLHAQGELFILRNPAFKFKGDTLAHEVAHLATSRLIGPMPLWLNEGYAEYAASKAYSAFMRARGYIAKPVSASVEAGSYIPLSRLLGITGYPSGKEINAFYDESHRLVRFLARDRDHFVRLMGSLANGMTFDAAFQSVYGTKYFSIDALEKEFKPYATGKLRGD